MSPPICMSFQPSSLPLMKPAVMVVVAALLFNVQGFELLTEAEIEEIEEILPLPQALKLVYPNIAQELRPELTEKAVTLDSLAETEQRRNLGPMQDMRRRYYLKKVLRRKRQKSGNGISGEALLKMLANPTTKKRLKLLPQTEFGRRKLRDEFRPDLYRPPGKIVKVISSSNPPEDLPEHVEVVDGLKDEEIIKEILKDDDVEVPALVVEVQPQEETRSIRTSSHAYRKPPPATSSTRSTTRETPSNGPDLTPSPSPSSVVPSTVLLTTSSATNNINEAEEEIRTSSHAYGTPSTVKRSSTTTIGPNIIASSPYPTLVKPTSATLPTFDNFQSKAANESDANVNKSEMYPIATATTFLPTLKPTTEMTKPPRFYQPPKRTAVFPPTKTLTVSSPTLKVDTTTTAASTTSRSTSSTTPYSNLEENLKSRMPKLAKILEIQSLFNSIMKRPETTTTTTTTTTPTTTTTTTTTLTTSMPTSTTTETSLLQADDDLFEEPELSDTENNAVKREQSSLITMDEIKSAVKSALCQLFQERGISFCGNDNKRINAKHPPMHPPPSPYYYWPHHHPYMMPMTPHPLTDHDHSTHNPHAKSHNQDHHHFSSHHPHPYYPWYPPHPHHPPQQQPYITRFKPQVPNGAHQ